jgi:Abortive infection C-terminus
LEAAKSREADPNQIQQSINNLIRRMERDGFKYQGGHFVSASLRLTVVDVPSLIAVTEESIAEQVEKAHAKIEAGDHSGAISSAYTLLEGFLKALLRRTGTPFNKSEGDIRELYKLVAQPLNLNPRGESLEGHLKTILQGLKSQVSGFYELAHKASDRHVRRYNPARHHAKLVVNATFVLCEFLLDSFEYQEKKFGHLAGRAR